MLLSICIPTYNRFKLLDNCLNSILISSRLVQNFEFEVCVSDNCSDKNVKEIINKYKNFLNISFNKNSSNLGFANNAKKVISMAKGKYAWLLGDDDLLIPETLSTLKNLFLLNPKINYFFINSYFLNSKELNNFNHPLDTNQLNLKNLRSISKIKKDLNNVIFWEVIRPKVSWDFLIGMYLSIFRKEEWLKHQDILNKDDISDLRPWSNFDNTCTHAKVLSTAFKNSKVYISAKPLSINLVGEREWVSLYEFIEIVRIPELLEYYRSQGMPFLQYLYCKNFSLRNFFNYFIKIIIGGNKSGLKYVNFKKHFLLNLLYPYVYLSIIFYLIRKLKNIIKI